MSPDLTDRRKMWQSLLPLAVIAAGLWAYQNSFRGAFLFDDLYAIVGNPRIRHLWPLWVVIRGTKRPVTELSFAINYALGGTRVWGYHAVNLAIHIVAALVLFGLVWRTLCTVRLQARYRHAAPGLALAVALLWLVHPLQTQSVTYIVQRAESLMGLCFLLTLYGVIRGATSNRPRPWYAAVVASCAVGMGTKLVMVTAPLVALLYDASFLAGSISQAWRSRRGLYLGLAATWGIVVTLLVTPEPHVAEPTVGLQLKDMTPVAYVLSQPGVILHYVRLALWPHPLVFDYAWPVANAWGTILPPTLIIGTLGLLTVGALRRRHPAGFLGAWFFLTLAPTSSFIPIIDLAVEHRMYLPLIAVLVLLVLGIHHLLQRFVPLHPRFRQGLAISLLLSSAAVLGAATIRRNIDYVNPVTMWTDTLVKRPQNPRAHNNLGVALASQGQTEEAMQQYQEALRLKPAYAEAHNNLGLALVAQGQFEEAVAHYEAALRLNPEYADVHNNLGTVLSREGKPEEAMTHFRAAIRLNPAHAEAQNNLGLALATQGHLDDAIAHYRAALRLNPRSVEVFTNLGVALAARGRFEEAIEQYHEALRLNPEYAEAYNNLGLALAAQGKFEEARSHYRKALELKPGYAQVLNNLGVSFADQGHLPDAMAQYTEALRMKPDYAEAHNNLGVALAAQGQVEEAIAHYRAALRFKPNFAEARINLERALSQQRTPQAATSQSPESSASSANKNE